MSTERRWWCCIKIDMAFSIGGGGYFCGLLTKSCTKLWRILEGIKCYMENKREYEKPCLMN
jgi:hypothetical protein